MSTRDLRVRFVGDAGNLRQTFQEVGTAAQASSVGLQSADKSANTVGQSFVKTGKLFRGTGRAFRAGGLDAASAGSSFLGAVPQLGAFASALGLVTIAGQGLSGIVASLGPVALPVLAGAAIAAGVAFLVMKDDVDTATAALGAQRKANEEVAASHRATTAAIYAHMDGLAALRGAVLSNEEAIIGVLRANQRLAKAEKESGKASLDYREALLAQKRAQEALRDSRTDLIRKAEEQITQTQKSNKAIDDEVASTRRAADAARLRARFLNQGLISGKDSAAVAKELQRALAAESKASAQSAAKHQDNAQRAREMAAAIGGATPRARALRDRLLELANTEVNLAAQQAAIRAIGSAAASAQAGVDSLVAALVRASNAPSPRSGGGGGGGGGGGSQRGPGGGQQRQERGQKSDALEAGRAFAVRGTRRGGSGSPLTASDRSSRSIAARHRDDTTQDKGVSARAIAGASGVTNPDKLADIGDRAVLAQRKKEIEADATDVRDAIKRVNDAISGKRRTLQSHRASRRNAKGKTPADTAKAQAGWTTKIRATLDAIRALFDERRALNTEAAEIKAEGKDIDYDIGILDAAIASTPDSVPPEPGSADAPPTTADFLNAGVAEAALTPGLEDDIAAAKAVEAQAQADLDAARASGDPRRVADAAQALLAARTSRENLEATNKNTDALNANTASNLQLTGSTVFGYRGQDWVLRSLSPPSSDRLVGAETGM